MRGEPERSEAWVNVLPVDLDLAKLLATNAGPIVGGLLATIGGIVGGLIVRGTARSSSRKERTDEYRREVRSAASSIVRAARTFIDAATAFNRSIFWIQNAVRTTPDHDESYLACQAARAELDEKVADFQFLVDIDALSDAAFMVYVHTSMAYYAMFNINSRSELANYTEAKLEDERNQIRKFTEALEKKALPKFRESVKKYVPHTIVEEKRRRTRIPRALTASWRWLMKQHRKNLSPHHGESRRLEVALRCFSDQPETLGLGHTVALQHPVPGAGTGDPSSSASQLQHGPDDGDQRRQPHALDERLHNLRRRHDAS